MLPTKVQGLTQSLVQPGGMQRVLQPPVGSCCPKPELSLHAQLVPAQHGHCGYFSCSKDCDKKPSSANGPVTSAGWHGGQY